MCLSQTLECTFNVHDRYLQFIVSDTFKFYNSQCPNYFNEIFCPVDDNGIATHCCNEKLKLPFCQTKLGMQNLSYVGLSTWNKLPNNVKTATNVNCFKQNIRKYFLKKLSETKLISIVTLKEKALELEHNQDKYTFCFYFLFYI